MIGKIIQEKRKALGMTQAQLAERLGVTAPAVNRWEKDLCYPDVSLLAPLARLLKTDLNELFSFYESLSDTERKLAANRCVDLVLEKPEEEAFAQIDALLHENLSDGMLYKRVAEGLYGIHVLKKSIDPSKYLERICAYYERALELLPEQSEEISAVLMEIYAKLGMREKAEAAYSGLREAKFDKKLEHAQMLVSLKEYEAAASELEEGILRQVIDVSERLELLRDVLHHKGDEELSALADEKAAALRKLFELWSGYDSLSNAKLAIADQNPEDEAMYLIDFIQQQTPSDRLSHCPLFQNVQLGGKPRDDSTTADTMADIVRMLNKLPKTKEKE